MNEATVFGRRVRAIRKANRLTLDQAAEKVQLDAKYLARIERGEKRPSFETIFALSRVFNVPVSALFMFDREEKDARNLRRRIDKLLNQCNPEQLLQAYRHIQAIIEP